MKPYWIKERQNPQLGTYFILCGQMSVKSAHAQTSSLYGTNTMRRFDTEAAYHAEVENLRKAGERVQ